MINICSNATGWDHRKNRIIPGGMTDRYVQPILDQLDAGVVTVARQPRKDAVNIYLAVRGRYNTGRREIGRASVQISHGIADKQYRDAGKMRSFDHVVVPGPAHARRVRDSGLRKERIRQLGYPKLDPYFTGHVQRQPRTGDRIRVLWAPTHGGGSERFVHGNPQAPGAGATSWWHRDAILSLLADRFEVAEAPHPRHRPDKAATFAEYATADVVIADGGSTIYEAWALGIPVVFPTWLTAERNIQRGGGVTLEGQIYRERIGWHADAPEQLADQVDQAAELGIGDSATRFIDDVLPPELRGMAGKLHAEFFLELDASAPPSAAKTRRSRKYRDLMWPSRASAPPRRTVAPVPEPANTAAPAATAVATVEETPTAVPAGATSMPEGTAAEVLARVGNDPVRAQEALEAERQRDKPRTSLLAQLTKRANNHDQE